MHHYLWLMAPILDGVAIVRTDVLLQLHSNGAVPEGPNFQSPCALRAYQSFQTRRLVWSLGNMFSVANTHQWGGEKSQKEVPSGHIILIAILHKHTGLKGTNIGIRFCSPLPSCAAVGKSIWVAVSPVVKWVCCDFTGASRSMG